MVSLFSGGGDGGQGPTSLSDECSGENPGRLRRGVVQLPMSARS